MQRSSAAIHQRTVPIKLIKTRKTPLKKGCYSGGRGLYGDIFCPGDNPIKYTDPTGLWVNNKDGTFTAEKGDTLWGLGQETGRDWKTSDYKGEPQKLQIGQVVSFAEANEANSHETVDSTIDAVAHYYFGNGEPTNLGSKTIDALLTNTGFQSEIQKIESGDRKPSDNISVNLTDQIFHVGRTRVKNNAVYIKNQALQLVRSILFMAFPIHVRLFP